MYAEEGIIEKFLIDNNLTFTMGCVESLGFVCVHRDVTPPFRATLSPYFIGKYLKLKNPFLEGGCFAVVFQILTYFTVFDRRHNRVKF